MLGAAVRSDSFYSVDDVRELIEGSDLNGLVRRIDGLTSARDWDGIVELRDRCVEAVDRGKQLWGVALFAEYRLALDAPGPLAGKVVKEGAGRFALGPLWEVAASTHQWDDLAPHVDDSQLRTLIAHERLLRGEHTAATEVMMKVSTSTLKRRQSRAWSIIVPKTQVVM